MAPGRSVGRRRWGCPRPLIAARGQAPAWTRGWAGFAALQHAVRLQLAREREGLTLSREVEERWQFAAVGQSGLRHSQLVEKHVCACVERRDAARRRVLEQLAD